ncbi:MAG TPA: hypothetical protein VFA02_12530 [Pseudacidobacterium sp.]|nr:hypothetical protein [Pseudacidobacterium sp.]
MILTTEVDHHHVQFSLDGGKRRKNPDSASCATQHLLSGAVHRYFID